MSKKISILLTDNQYEELVQLATKEKLTINDLVLSNLPITQEKKVTLADVIKRVNNLPSQEFNIPSLYSKKEWESFTKGSRLTVGKQFYKYSLTTSDIKFLRKNSANLAIYKKN